MRIQTFTIVAGSEACNARCPYCVSRMTPDYDLDEKLPAVNWRNFQIGCRFAKDSGVTTVLLTGKGEPTLFPDQLTAFLEAMADYSFPFIEIQTNGMAMAEGKPVTDEHLKAWYELGLTTVALSVVHWEAEPNRNVFAPHHSSYYELDALVGKLHAMGFSVRITCMLVKGWVDSQTEVSALVDFARSNEVEQLTVRSIVKPDHAHDEETARWVDEHLPPPGLVEDLKRHLDEGGTRVLELVHGSIVYDYEGQNVCLGNCLTVEPGDERIRQLIFFPDGHLRYAWQYPGAILL